MNKKLDKLERDRERVLLAESGSLKHRSKVDKIGFMDDILYQSRLAKAKRERSAVVNGKVTIKVPGSKDVVTSSGPYTGHGWDGNSPPPKKSRVRWCCGLLKAHVSKRCSLHSRYECSDCLLDRHKDGKIGIIIHDGGCSMVAISFCPWCGAKLPYGRG